MRADHRSGCPINLTLEVIGDKWSLLIIRDMIFRDRRHFRELLLNSEEGVASNILSDRMKRLVDQGIITKADDPSHKQKAIYSLTEQGIQLLPVLAQMAGWGHKYLPVTKEHSIGAKLLEEGGAKMWDKFMSELRDLHLGAATRRKSRSGTASVAAKLGAAKAAVVARGTATRKARRRPVASRIAKRTLNGQKSKSGK
jgi:DNA-binding HxlR family transcriptional regulator